jgi:hypothetical protein
MLSARLVHLIESHWEEIVSRVIAQSRRELQLTETRALVESEMREWGRVLLENLSHWLAKGSEDEVSSRYEHIGKVRYEEGVPLHVSVHLLCILREKMLDFVDERIFSKSSLELYEEEELHRRLGRFFDLLTIHLVHGYEAAWKRASMIARA